MNRASYDLTEVHDLSVEILEFLEDQDITVGLAVASLALSLGRLMNPRQGPLSEAEEINYTQNLMEWSHTFMADGKVN